MPIMTKNTDYNEDTSELEDYRRRPESYFGRLGNGSDSRDGIYTLVKETVNNAIDEFNVGAGDKIEVSINPEGQVTVRDYGRGIRFDDMSRCLTHYGDSLRKRYCWPFFFSEGLEANGLMAVNALSANAEVISFRGGQFSSFNFVNGKLVNQNKGDTTEKNGTLVRFIPDKKIFPRFSFNLDIVRANLWHNACLNTGLELYLNGELFHSAKGLVDFLTKDSYFRTKTYDGKMFFELIHNGKPIPDGKMCYEPIHGESYHSANIERRLLEGEIPEAGWYENIPYRDRALEFAFSHFDCGQNYFHFFNGAYFNDNWNIFALGCVHLNAFREGILKGINKYSGQEFIICDLRRGFCGALSIRVFDTSSEHIRGYNMGNPETQAWIIDQVSEELVKYLDTNSSVAKALIDKIQLNSKVRKQANEGHG